VATAVGFPRYPVHQEVGSTTTVPRNVERPKTRYDLVSRLGTRDIGTVGKVADRLNNGIPECRHRVIVGSGDFEPNTLSVENVGLRSGVPHLVRGSRRAALSRVSQRSSDSFASGSPIKRCGSQPSHAGSIFADRVEKLRNAAPMVLKTLPDSPAFYNAPNETALIADRDSAATTIERMAARLLTAVSHPKAVACEGPLL